MTFEEAIILLPSHGLEDFPYDVPEEQAAGLLNAFAVVWHPRLMSLCQRLPRWEPADQPVTPRPGQLVIVPTACEGYLSHTWPERARAAGARVISGLNERQAFQEAVLTDIPADDALEPELTADFLAFGSTLLHQELLTREMRNYSQIDQEALLREGQAAARAALGGQGAAARMHLGKCFELLLECRERYYPVDCWLIDLCMVTPELAGDELRTLLASEHHCSLLSPNQGWREILQSDESWKQSIAEAAKRGSVEIVGGQAERCDTLQSLDAQIHSLLESRQWLRENFGVEPVTWGRKRFGLSAQLPQLLKRSGYSAALHFALDDGIYPEEELSLLRWKSSGNVEIDAFSRIPLAADSASAFIRFPQRMAESMDYDHSAAVVFLRWPRMKTPFFEDFLRAHRYQPVFGKFVTFAEFFARSTVPGKQGAYPAAQYRTPSLVQAAASQTPDPISRWVRFWEREREWRRVDWLQGVVPFLRGLPRKSASLETIVRAAHVESNPQAQQQAEEQLAAERGRLEPEIARLVDSRSVAGPGVLIVNPHSFPRRAVVEWPAGTMPPEHPLVSVRQVDGKRGLGLVELPPCGFAWLPAEPISASTTPGKLPLAEKLLVRTDDFEVRLSPVTGGIGQIATFRRSPNRISQQVALRFSQEREVPAKDGNPEGAFRTHYTAMRLRETEVLSAGPLLGEVQTVGDLVDEQSGTSLGVYRQRTRTVRHQPLVEVEVEIGLHAPLSGVAWGDYLACRFAWAHEDVVLSASMAEGAHVVTSERIESPQFLEIAEDKFRTTILSPGQPYFRKSGERMLDMLLGSPGETATQFRFAVAVDEAYPMQAHLEAFSPPLVIPTSTRPAEGGRQGWFFQVSSSNVQLQRLLPGKTDNSVIVRLLETEGRAVKTQLASCRLPRSARQVDFLGQTINELAIEGSVAVEISPYEICDVELLF